MKHGHVLGTRRTRPADTRWYAAIEAATLARLEATWPDEHTNATPEVAMTPTQAAGSNAQAAGIIQTPHA